MWLSQATFTYLDARGDERLALLPYSPGALLLAVAAAAGIWAALRHGASPAPLALLALLFVPWIPAELPPALMLWTGRLGFLVWFAIAAGMAAPFVRRLRVPRPYLTVAAAACLISGASFIEVRPQLPGGDEPHYLVITQSLLNDGDVRIENNHLERQHEPYYAGTLRPDFRVRGRNGVIYSIHAPGVSALVAPAFLIAGYPGVVLFLLVMSVAGSVLAWHLAWLVTRDRTAAWFGWAAVTLSATWIFHSFAVFPDGPGAVLILTGVWALLRAGNEARGERGSLLTWGWHGAALAALPWLHTRFAVLAAGLGALVLLRLAAVQNPAAKALAFLAVPALSMVGWFASFVYMYGTPDPSAPYGGEPGALAFVPDGLAGLLFDQGFGLLMYAPVLLFGFVGIGTMAARQDLRRLALEHLFVIVPYLVVVTHFAMWWGGRSAPARFFVPVLLWMAIPAAVAWTRIHSRATRVSALAALAFTGFASAVLVIARDGALAFNERESSALWLEWLNGSVQLSQALPMWWRADELPLFRGIAIWGTAAVAAWSVLRWIERQQWARSPVVFGTVAAGAYAVAASLAASVAWNAQNVSGRDVIPGQMEALRRLSRESQLLVVSFSPLTLLQPRQAASLLVLEPPTSSAAGGAGRGDRPLYTLAAVPAGEYTVRPVLRGSEGWLMLGIGRDQFALRTLPLADAGQAVAVSFPVDVRALVVRGDEDARANVQQLVFQPVRLVQPDARLTNGYARQAVRYGSRALFFLDDGSYPEPEGFWVRGSRITEVVLQADQPKTEETLRLRNGAVPNTVVLSTGRWREELRLAAGEERLVQIPSDPERGASLLRITSSSGFRPSSVDRGSSDHRYLGVRVELPD